MIAEAISGCLHSVKHAIVPNYADNAQAVVAKHARTSRRLCDAVRFECSPLFYSCLISKKESDKIFPDSYRLSKRSMDMNPSI